MLRPDPENMVDPDSEQFFAAVRMTSGSAPFDAGRMSIVRQMLFNNI